MNMVLVVPPCDCTERKWDAISGAAHYESYYAGWIWHDVEKRTPSWRGCEPTNGEPYIYHCCPYCGGRLPNVRHDEEDHRPFGQADGESGG